MLIFYFLAALVIWLGVLSLRGGFRFAAYVRRDIARSLSDVTPPVSIIAPCRGLEDGLRQNLAALFDQDYPAYEIIFVSDRVDDPSLSLVKEIIETAGSSQRVSARVVIAGEAVVCGQKVHNLLAAVAKVDPRSEVLVFVDTDARPLPGWLRSLVSPLRDESIGAATGYRWFIPDRGGFASQLRSVWNGSIASALGDREDKNFCWGGSTAILKSTFDKLQIPAHWRGTVSDDFTLTRVLQEAKLPIHFVPACIVASFGNCTVRELLEFTNRQLKITRVYAPHLWKPLLAGSLFFCSVFFGGLILVIARALLGYSYLVPLVFLLLIFALGAAKAYIRLKSVAMPLAPYEKRLSQSLPAQLLLWPLASGLYFYNALAAAFSRRITWRGITYELKSPSEAVIISREQ
jgi:ceramide glucosyltransferase